MEKVKITVDGKEITAQKRANLLKTLLDNGFEIPNLCYHETLKPYGVCRVCVVKITRNGKTKIATSCNYLVADGLQVMTASEDVLQARNEALQTLLARAPASEPLKEYAAMWGVSQTSMPIEDPSEKCIMCGLCVRVCKEVVGANAICFEGKGRLRRPTTPTGGEADKCILCGACAYICPTGCITFEEIEARAERRRKIDNWHRELALIACKKCGHPYMPSYQAQYFSQLTHIPQDFFDICPNCRATQ